MPPAYLKGPSLLPSVNIPFWCAGKVKFESAVIANQAAQRNKEAGHRQIYLCRTCGSWHVGTSAWKKAVMDEW